MYPFNRAYVYAQGDEHVGIARGGDDNKSGGASERANRKAVRDEYNALHTE
jgi:hypothetical protein